MNTCRCLAHSHPSRWLPMPSSRFARKVEKSAESKKSWPNFGNVEIHHSEESAIDDEDNQCNALSPREAMNLPTYSRPSIQKLTTLTSTSLQHESTCTMRQETSRSAPSVFERVNCATSEPAREETSAALGPRWSLNLSLLHDCNKTHQAQILQYGAADMFRTTCSILTSIDISILDACFEGLPGTANEELLLDNRALRNARSGAHCGKSQLAEDLSSPPEMPLLQSHVLFSAGPGYGPQSAPPVASPMAQLICRVTQTAASSLHE